MTTEALYEAVTAIERARIAMIEVQRSLMKLDVPDSETRAREAAGAAVKLGQLHRRLLREQDDVVTKPDSYARGSE